jgi:hypothetical protein
VVGASILALVLLLERSRRFPEFMVGYDLASLTFIAADFLASDLVPAIAAENGPESARELGRAALSCAIWVPYRYLSERVRNTFVHTPAA